jgi:pimeloyl-ACP methyl ester carboxylesterase
MNPDLWRQSGAWLMVSGQRLFVRSVGQGPPVLVLHAFPTSSYDYSRFVPLLSDRYRFILFDYPGYGFSDKPRAHAYSLLENAQALKAVAAHFGVTQAFVLAHDIGDSVALIALTHRALAIEKLVLLNGSVVSIQFTDPVMRLTQRLLLHPTTGPLIARLGLINRSFFASTAKQLFSYPLPRQELDAFWSIIRYDNGAPLYPILMRYMLERWQFQYDWLDALEKHDAPLTLLWGQLDPIATPAVADAVMARRPDATYVRLHHVGHYPHWEASEIVADAVRIAFG